MQTVYTMRKHTPKPWWDDSVLNFVIFTPGQDSYTANNTPVVLTHARRMKHRCFAVRTLPKFERG